MGRNGTLAGMPLAAAGGEVRRLLAASCVASLGLCALPHAASATIAVGRCGDMVGKGGYTLRQAVANALDGDTVDLSTAPATCSTITLTGGEIPIVRNSLTISGPTDRAITIDGNVAGRVFNHSGSGVLLLSYVTLSHGSTGGKGGCILSTGAQVSLSHATVNGCQAGSDGGGIYATNLVAAYSSISGNAGLEGGGAFVDGATMLVHSSVSNNITGGGIFSVGTVTSDYSTISGNQSTSSGGGIHTPAGAVHLYGSTVSGNTSAASGGGVASQGALTATNSVIAGNDAGANGGGLYTVSGPLTLTACSLDANQAADLGGAASVRDFGALTSTSSTFSRNTGTRGGATFAYDTRLYNSTLSSNRAATSGAIDTSRLVLRNSTVAFNDATDTSNNAVGGILTGSSSLDVQSSIIAMNTSAGVGAKDIYVGGDQPFLPGASLIMSSNKATLSLSANPQLGPLAYHGGSTKTHALQSTSPAVNAGANPSGLGTDQRGSGYPRIVGVAADIGAYERQGVDDQIFFGLFD